MNKGSTVFALAIAAALWGYPAVGAAEDVMMLQENQTSFVTGKILNVKRDSFTMESAGDQKILVDLEKVGLTDHADKMFRPGMQVSVTGEIEEGSFDPVIRALSVATQGSPDEDGEE